MQLENIKSKLSALKKELVEQTIEMNSLKLTINSSFGKFGSPYSTLYSPKLLIQVTLTGQLSLLLLIETLEANGIQVVSANTDGVVTLSTQEQQPLLKQIIAWWEQTTRFEMERTDYKALYSRDVNNYIAVKPNNKVKTKGAFSYAGLQKNPETEVCIDAVIKYLTDGTPLDTTVCNETDIRKFLLVRAVKGGAIKDSTYLGKVVRWYYSTETDTPITYRTNGNKVPKSDNGQPCMTLPPLNVIPDDLDRAVYIREAHEMLMDLGVIPRPPKVRKTRKKKGE